MPAGGWERRVKGSRAGWAPAHATAMQCATAQPFMGLPCLGWQCEDSENAVALHKYIKRINIRAKDGLLKLRTTWAQEQMAMQWLWDSESGS